MNGEVLPESGAAPRRTSWVLALGAGAGIVMAAAGILSREGVRRDRLPPGAAARVNGEIIGLDEYRRALDGVDRDRRDGIDAEARRRVLDRLVDEELLVQRGIELGLTRQDKKVRADIAAAVIAAVVAERDDVRPDDAELAEFYEEHKEFFAEPGRVRLSQLFFRAGEAAADEAAGKRALDAVRRLRAGEPIAAVRKSADTELAPLPEALLPASKVREYLGLTVARTALGLDVGEVSDPIRSGAGYHVIVVDERELERIPPLEEIRPQVLAEYRRRAGEAALREYIDGLRARAKVAVVSEAP